MGSYYEDIQKSQQNRFAGFQNGRVKSNSSSNDGSTSNTYSDSGNMRSGSMLNSYANQLSSMGGDFSSLGGSAVKSSLSSLLRSAAVSEQDMVNDATQDVNGAYSRGRESGMRNLSRMGINPTSGRFAGAEKDYALARAAAEAGARNRARITSRNQSFANYGQIAGMGANIANAGMNAVRGAGDMYQNYLESQDAKAVNQFLMDNFLKK